MIIAGFSSSRKEKMPKPKKRGAEFPDIEKEVYDWVLEEGAAGLMVSNSDIREKALEVAQRDNVQSFKASVGWVTKMKSRQKLAYRVPTHTSRKTEFTAEDIVSECSID